MYITLLMLLVFFIIVAMQVNTGMWSNAITFMNVLISALVATSLWEPAADRLEAWEPSFTYLWDLLMLWGVFALTMMVLRTVTDLLSRVKMRFKKPVDIAGGIFFACWTGWIMICFTMMTLHTAPLARNFLQGQFQAEPQSRMFFGLAPDRKWLAFVHKMSLGTMARSSPNEFDPHGEYIFKYGERRARFEKEPGQGAFDLRVNPPATR